MPVLFLLLLTDIPLDVRCDREGKAGPPGSCFSQKSSIYDAHHRIVVDHCLEGLLGLVSLSVRGTLQKCFFPTGLIS